MTTSSKSFKLDCTYAFISTVGLLEKFLLHEIK